MANVRNSYLFGVLIMYCGSPDLIVKNYYIINNRFEIW